MTATSPITPYVSWDEVRAIYDQFGGVNLYARVPESPRWLRGTVGLRWTAEQIRQLDDDVFPDRPARIADAMDELAARHEARPVSGDDVLDVASEDVDLFEAWASRCRERSDMLDTVQSQLGWLCDHDPRVDAARGVLGNLADADLLLPGIAAALRPVLARYAGEGAPGTPELVAAPAEETTAAADTREAPSHATLFRLIRDLLDSDDCWFDHHGGCQAHGYLSLEPGALCPPAEAKLVLAAEGVGQ